ncbi:MAG: hypothetical protein CMJ46_12830 [Planctomyces sp.]|nr:hypothetical protein [Planctomyces sp.]
MDHSAFFESWNSLFKVLVSTVSAYLILILYIRLAGKRSTSKMNNFDWIVTVAVGSVVASMAVLKDVTVLDGIVAMALLLGLQYLLTWSTSRWEWAQNLFLAPSSVLYAHGEFRRDEMRRNRISDREILSAVRESGVGSLEDVAVITLEPDANLSIIKAEHSGELDTVKEVPGYEVPPDEDEG